MSDDEVPVEGCRWCDIGQREHGIRWTAGLGFHQWSAPDTALMRRRMWSRRIQRLARVLLGSRP